MTLRAWRPETRSGVADSLASSFPLRRIHVPGRLAVLACGELDFIAELERFA